MVKTGLTEQFLYKIIGLLWLLETGLSWLFPKQEKLLPVRMESFGEKGRI